MKNRGGAMRAIGLLAIITALLTTSSLAFQLTQHGQNRHVLATRNSRRVSSVPVPAACSRTTSMATPSPRSDQQRDDSISAYETMSSNSGHKQTAKTDVAALVLSALLLGGSGIPPGAANAAATVGSIRPAPADTVKQASLIADLEQRLLSMQPVGDKDQAKSKSEASTSAATVDVPSVPQDDEEGSAKSLRTQPFFVGVGSSAPTGSVDLAENALRATADAVATQTPTVDAPANADSSASKINLAKPANSEPLVKFQQLTFSITVPELNLPPIGPITLPEEGFGPPSFELSRVAPASNVPFGDVLKGMLQKAGDSGELLKSIAGISPKQNEFERAVTDFEQRAQEIVKNTQHPLFPSGAPLAPEFTSMFSAAKQTAAKALGPYVKPSQVEPASELAIFMLATLPVLTVALRTADVNSRRPMPPRGHVVPRRKVKFPKSPAKVDRAAVEEAQAAAATMAAAVLPVAAAAATVVPGASTVAVTVGSLSQEPEAEVAKETLAEGGLGGDVAAAAAADPAKLQAELQRLRTELQAATQLTQKVKALEQANARLRSQVAELNMRPSPEEAMRQAGLREAREAVERERAEKQQEMQRGIAERKAKIMAAREKMAQSFPAPDESTLFADDDDDVDVESGESQVTMVGELNEDEQEEKDSDIWLSVDKETLKPGAEERSLDTEEELPTETETVLNSNAAAAVEDGGSVVGAGKSLPKAEEPKRVEVNNEVLAESEAEVGEKTPNDYEGASNDLSRALGGVRGFDLDALDLEMDDLRPEDLEELRNLELEMGDLDMASLEAEFDQEDDETISNALRMAAESAMAHTSGGGRSRIRTATGMGSPSSPSPTQQMPASELQPQNNDRAQGVHVVLPENEGYDLSDLEWDGYPMIPREDGEVAREGTVPAESRGGEEMGEGGGGGGDGAALGEWSRLTASALKRKTIPELKGFLEQRGVRAASKAKKAELVDLVSELLQAA